MPRRDGSGPWGMGPLTGRGFGPCGGARGYGYGFRRAPGWGRGPRRAGLGYGQAYGYGWSAEGNRRDFLKAEKEMLKEQLAWIEQEIENDRDN